MRSHFNAAQQGFIPGKAFRRMAAMAAGGFDGPGFGPGGPGFGPGRDFGPSAGPDLGPGRGFGGGHGRGFGHGRDFGGGRARRGDVRSAILGLLAEGPSNGYGLIKAIAEKTDGAWKPSPGSVYPTLAQLVDEGLVAKEDGPRGAYSLTDEGTAHVTEHREAIDAALDNAREGGSGSELRDAARKLMGSLQQFRGASAEQQSRAKDKVDQLRRELYGILAE
ncbi:MAG: PadR family transcriptional regulator [Propionibacteriaceae bacterium]|nr:MAG: PadR family transcriptional regulator [Propionibacteriaceae bacterium]